MRGVVGLVGKVSEKERGFFWVVVKEYLLLLLLFVHGFIGLRYLLRLESIRWIDRFW
jgi:succinate dehydrogenase/fumarate reductase cytochrome b subunit